MPQLRFDSSVFGISALESRSMDPQMALALEVCAGALQATSNGPLCSDSSHTGVFLGMCGSTMLSTN